VTRRVLPTRGGRRVTETTLPPTLAGGRRAVVLVAAFPAWTFTGLEISAFGRERLTAGTTLRGFRPLGIAPVIPPMPGGRQTRESRTAA